MKKGGRGEQFIDLLTEGEGRMREEGWREGGREFESGEVRERRRRRGGDV